MFSSHGSSHVPELKTNAAVEASRDPQSNVTAGDAEKTMMEEAKRAGAATFQFDANASPEDKAAQAHASLPAGFHRQHKATGIVTDIDDGSPDQYDLPPPSKEGAMSESTSRAADGSVTIPNGQLPLDEKSRWDDRVGWAPRFGQGQLTEAEANESLLDHATVLESKLDDKFFGDWYHNTGIIIFACIASWVVAVLGGGLAWVFIVMAICGTYYRTSIRRVRRNFRDDVHREFAKARLETDTESLEWINSFLVKFWPIYAPVLCETIIASVDQVLSTSTPAFLDSLRLKFFTLGTKPPRLDHVKTYPKTEDNIVLMDWKFSFTPGDRMDLTARQLKEKINPKIVLEVRIGKGVISKGIDVIVEDMAFSGLMRLKVKLQIPFPHIEKVEMCFLGKPDIDYVCKPLGGDTLGFDINFVPGLESFIKEQIHGNLQPIMYDPNVFPIEIAKMLAGNPVDQAIGVIAVTLHGAQALKNPDNFAGSPDPYVLVSLNGRAALGKTKIVKENANPRWNETVYVIITSLSDALTLQVFDYNEFRKDKDLGTASFALDRLEQVSEHENLHLEVMANGKPRGIVQADVRFFPVLVSAKSEDGRDLPPPESNTGIARFTVEQAKDLDGSKSLVGQLNPYVVLLLNGKEIHVSKKLKRTNQPIWPDASKEFLVTDRKAARLGLVIKDDRDVAADPILGTYQIKLNDMLQQTEQGKEWYHLSGAKTGRAKLTVQWKPVALKGITGGSGGYITPIGVMRLHFQSARDLRNVETMGKSDPYVRVLLSGIEKAKTVTFQSNLNPDWDEVVYVPMHSSRERLTLDVMDYQNIGKDRSLGLVELSAAEYIQEDENGEYLVHNELRPQSLSLRMNGIGNPKGKLNFTAAFYPTISVADPEEEDEEPPAPEVTVNGTHTKSTSKASVGPEAGKGTEPDPVAAANAKEDKSGNVSKDLAKQLDQAEKEQSEGDTKKVPKLKLAAADLVKYETGLIVIKVIEGEFSQSNVHLELLMDDMAFPSFSTSRARSKQTTFGETGDAMVREVDVSRMTLRLMEKEDKKGEDNSEHVVAKLVGETLPTLQRCLYTPTELILKGNDGSINKIRVSLKYLPIKMTLDPSESINNMGTLRVEVLDAADLPAADRNGKSDPYCKFELNGGSVYKTKTQKKTLSPTWNESFEVPIKSRIAADFKVRVMDWDFGDKADFLGDAKIHLADLEPMTAKQLVLPLQGESGGKAGSLRLRLLFKSSYVVRSRQGSSTFSGTMGPAGKVIGAPVKGVGMVGGAVGGGVIKGASFLRHGFKSSKGDRQVSNGYLESPPEETPQMTNGDSLSAIPSIETPQRDVSGSANPAPPFTPTSPHHRATSFGSRSVVNATGSGTPGKPDAGTATLAILSASGFPPSAKLQVHIKQTSGKGSKEVHKTKGLKASSGAVHWEGETVKVNCAPDTQFLIQVKDDKFIGSDELGEAVFYIDDSVQGSEKEVLVAGGVVVVRSCFVLPDAASVLGESPKQARRSFLGRREGSRQGTPG